MNLTHCSGEVQGGKVFYSHLILPGEAARNEAWAVQQQSLDGYKPKHHGFFDFGIHKSNMGENIRELKWWCFKDKQKEEILAPYRRKEQERKEKTEKERLKLLADEQAKKDREFEDRKKKSKDQKDQKEPAAV